MGGKKAAKEPEITLSKYVFDVMSCLAVVDCCRCRVAYGINESCRSFRFGSVGFGRCGPYDGVNCVGSCHICRHGLDGDRQDWSTS